MEKSDRAIGAWRIVREGDGIQLQVLRIDEQKWTYISMTRAELMTFIDALNEVVQK
jgi:hypothetical protein